MRAEELFDAFDDLDPELLYDARTDRLPRLRVIRRLSVAAVIVIAAVVSFFIYSYAHHNTAVSYIWLDSRVSVALVCDAKGDVTAQSCKEHDFSYLIGEDYRSSVDDILNVMLDEGYISSDENTVIIGTAGSLSKDCDIVNDTVQNAFKRLTFDASTVSVICDKPSAKEELKADTAKLELIKLLTKYDDSLYEASLNLLSANDLNLILQGIDTGDRVSLSGNPSDSLYIGADAARDKAVFVSVIDKSDIDEIKVTFGVYAQKLIYRVRLKSGERVEEYLINALTGSFEHSYKNIIDHIESKATEAVDQSSIQTEAEDNGISYRAETYQPNETIAPDNILSVQDSTEAYTDPTDAEDPDALDSLYTDIPLTMRELAFISSAPPDNSLDTAFETVFEGQYFERRYGEKINSGSAALITSSAQLREFLAQNDYPYTDADDRTFDYIYDDEFFKNNYLIASACTFSDASYLTTVTTVNSDDSSLYAEISLSYGDSRSGEYYCRTLSLHSVSTEYISLYPTLIVY